MVLIRAAAKTTEKPMKQIDLQPKKATTRPRPSEDKDHAALTRLKAGKEAWNSWARGLLEEKQELENSGQWQIERLWDEEANGILAKSEDKAVQNWLERARTDLSNLTLTSQVQNYRDKRHQDQVKGAEGSAIGTDQIILEGDEIDFSELVFPAELLLQNTAFLAPVTFAKAQFCSDANFTNTCFEKTAKFSRTRFKGDAWFEEATFKGNARFKKCTFHLAAWFNKTRFNKKFNLSECLVSADLWLNEVLMKGRTQFENLYLKSDTYINEAVFKERVYFKNITVQGELQCKETQFMQRAQFEQITAEKAAYFNQSDFNGYTIFNNSTFKQAANFKAIHVAKAIALEHLVFTNEVPNFLQSMIREPAQLAGLSILPRPKRRRLSPHTRRIIKAVQREPKPLRKLLYIDSVYTDWLNKTYAYYKNRFLNKRRKTTDETYYKTMRLIASRAGNLAAERELLAGEIRARRHVKDRLKAIPTGSINYLKGVFREITSDFGRSIIRPALCWGLVMTLFTGLYLLDSRKPLGESCSKATASSPLKAMQTLSIHNALALQWYDSKQLQQAELCLYGEKPQVAKPVKDQARLVGKGGFIKHPPPPPIPNTPPRVHIFGAIQTALSILLFSLLLINTANRWRMH